MEYISIILVFISIILFAMSIAGMSRTHKINTDVDEKNRILAKETETLKKSYDDIRKTLSQSQTELTANEKVIAEQQKELRDINKTITDALDSKTKALESQQATTRKAFENYCEVLEQEYSKKDKEYAELCNKMAAAYNNKQKDLIAETAQYAEELDKIRSTRQATLAAARAEQEIKDNLSFYCLPLSISDKADIEMLEAIKPRLTKPRVLSMLIWQTYFQKPMTSLCNNVVGTKKITGIYKITNTIDSYCYIGQSLDISERWKSHAKCGLDIDTPVGNKLYKAMIKDGIQNFSWEVLEECPADQLDEKEAFYIDLYQSKDYGYNSTAGNKKN